MIIKLDFESEFESEIESDFETESILAVKLEFHAENADQAAALNLNSISKNIIEFRGGAKAKVNNQES